MKSILQIYNKISDLARTFFLCAVFYVNKMCDHSLFLASKYVTSPPVSRRQGVSEEGRVGRRGCQLRHTVPMIPGGGSIDARQALWHGGEIGGRVR